MPLLIEHHLDAIRALCERHGVRRLELFGSALRDDFDATTSDADFLVDFSDPASRGAFKRYMSLKFDLEALLGRSVDLVETSAVRNPKFLTLARRTSEVVYVA